MDDPNNSIGSQQNKGQTIKNCDSLIFDKDGTVI